MGNLIHDGQSRPGLIKAKKGLHEGLSFSFRPMLPVEADVFVRPEFSNLPPSKSVAAIATAVAKHLVSWSEDASATADNVARLPWDLFNALFNIVAGFRASDEADDAKPSQQSDDPEILLESLQRGVSIGVVADEAQAKNSARG